ncbi:MAG: T9SS type A sorting domain-containing protein [Bacteroidales bacterium]|jgi:hypothetical protein|nr:T9SS type A sorting domain-containing protein [Bacteroidales bacterium]
MKRTFLLFAALIIGATSVNAQKFISKDALKKDMKSVMKTERVAFKKQKPKATKDAFVYGEPVISVSFDNAEQYSAQTLSWGHTAGETAAKFRVFADTSSETKTALQGDYPRIYQYFAIGTYGFYFFDQLVGPEVGNGFAIISPFVVWQSNGGGGETPVASRKYNTVLNFTEGFSTEGFNTVDVVFNQTTMRFNSDRYYVDYSTDPTFATYDSIEFNVKGIEMSVNAEVYGQKIVTLPVAETVGKEVLYIRLRYYIQEVSTDQPAGYWWIVDEVKVYNGPETRLSVVKTWHQYAAYGTIPQGMAMDTIMYAATLANTGGNTLYSLSPVESFHRTSLDAIEFPFVFGEKVGDENHLSEILNLDTELTEDTATDASGAITSIDKRREVSVGAATARMYNETPGIYGLSMGVEYKTAEDATEFTVEAMDDSLYYRVDAMPEADATGSATWGIDGGILVEGTAWAHGFHGVYITDNSTGATTPGYRVCNRYIVPADIETNTYYAKGVEIIPAADSCIAGAMVAAALQFYNDAATTWDEVIMPVTGPNGQAVASNTITTTEDMLNNGVFTTAGRKEATLSFNSIYMPFNQEGIALEPGQWYYACYTLMNNRKFYVATDDNSYVNTIKAEDQFVHVVFDPNGGNQYAWGYPFGSWSDDNAPMIRLMVSKNPLSISDINNSANSFDLKAYPNPATEKTTIEYTLTNNANVVISVTDIMGREVVRFDQGSRAANTINRVELNTTNMNNGTYFYTINAGGIKETKKLVVNK